MTGLRVTRWARYGHERLYVATDDGQRVGWLDVKTGVTTVEAPELSAALHEALEVHRAGPAGATTTAPAPSDSLLESTPDPAGRESSVVPAGTSPATGIPQPEPGWAHLAANRPGQGIRAEAQAARSQMWSRGKVRAVVALATDSNTQERRWRVGAKGEEAIGHRLERLVDRGWRVLHSIPVGPGKTDLDHLLIGTGGVYPINTKNRPDGQVWVGANQVRVNGRRTDYVQKSQREGVRVSRILSDAVGWPVPARPTLVILTGTLFPTVTYKEQPDGVIVLDRMDVPGWFTKSKHRLTPEQVDEIYQQARRSTTWPGT